MKRTNFASFLVILLLACADTCVWAGTYSAADCSRSSVNAVINGPTHVAVDGDVIQIPAGSCTWTSGITVSGVGITIAGAGTPNSTPSTTGASASCTQTAITVNNVSYLFTLSPGTSTSLSRLSCIKMLTTSPSSITGALITAWGTCNSSTCPNLRLDNITFDGSLQGCCASSSNGVITTDNIFGVIDHNTVSPGTGGSPGIEFINYMNSAWNGVGDFGDNSWASADSFGTAKVLYLENNLWGPSIVIGETEAQVNGHEGGGRIVGRFNTCNGCLSGLSNHGTDSNGRPRGGRQVEFYGNTFVCGNSGGCQGAVPVRSGVNIVFGNSLTNYPGDVPYHTWWNTYMNLGAFRANTIWGVPWNQCNGSGPYDDNSANPPICIDQPSRSGGTLLSGATPSPTGWANETIDPSYEWNDSGYNPVYGNVYSSYAGMIANRDWYTDNSGGIPHAQTSTTLPFNGTSGVGFGTLANRPTTCTPSVGYWATDQGKWNQSSKTYVGGYSQGQLYVCTATNTWTLEYTPYTYPHPLTGTVATPPASTTPSSPTGLQAVPQ